MFKKLIPALFSVVLLSNVVLAHNEIDIPALDALSAEESAELVLKTHKALAAAIEAHGEKNGLTNEQVRLLKKEINRKIAVHMALAGETGIKRNDLIIGFIGGVITTVGIGAVAYWIYNWSSAKVEEKAVQGAREGASASVHVHSSKCRHHGHSGHAHR